MMLFQGIDLVSIYVRSTTSHCRNSYSNYATMFYGDHFVGYSNVSTCSFQHQLRDDSPTEIVVNSSAKLRTRVVTFISVSLEVSRLFMLVFIIQSL